ncbi:protein ripply2 [Anser cygnoides]|uniref:protein ripply2 n=1 Tax=Anser cygnoides TaxID=8845 RepID=UPI0034D31207
MHASALRVYTAAPFCGWRWQTSRGRWAPPPRGIKAAPGRVRSGEAVTGAVWRSMEVGGVRCGCPRGFSSLSSPSSPPRCCRRRRHHSGPALTALPSPRSPAPFWRPWLPGPAVPRSPCGLAQGSRKLAQYAHPVRLFWPKSRCYDYLYQEAEALLKNFPVQATISFYEDSDSEDDEDDLEQDSRTESDC